MADGDIVSQINTTLAGSASNQPPSSGQTQWPLRYINAPGTNAPIIGYRGPGLVGISNNVEQQSQYDVSEGGVRNLYAEWSNDPNKQLYLDILKRKGYYGRGKIGNPQDDLNAIALMLDEANLNGVTYKRYLNDLLRNRPDEGGGGGAPRRYRVSNPDDLKAVFKRAAQDIIGRGFSDEEATRAVQAYQQQEIAAQQAMYGGATQVTEPPSADVFAQKFAQQIAPTEANGYKFLKIVNMISGATGGVQ